MTIHPDQLLALCIPAAVCVAGLLMMAARGVRERIRKVIRKEPQC